MLKALQPERLTTCEHGPELLLLLMRSLLSLSEVFPLTAELVASLAAAVPDAFNGPVPITPQLLESYSLVAGLCKAVQCIVHTKSEGTSMSQDDVSTSSLLGPVIFVRLQQHLSREFVESTSRRLSIASRISLPELLEVLQLLKQYEVAWSEGFVAACTSVCNHHTEGCGSTR